MTVEGGFHTLQLRVEGQVATVTLNRPEVRNAFNADMIRELTDVFGRFATSPVRAVLLRGSGKSFSAGADVTWMRASLEFSHEENLADAERMSDMFAAIDRCPKPVIVQVQGAALGGGMGLLAVCDVVVAADDAVFGFTETKLGIIPAVISRFVVPKIGESWTRALFLTGERFGTALARDIGLVHWIAEGADLERVTREKIGELLSAGPRAVEEAKALVQNLRGQDDAGRRTLTVQHIAALRTSPEGQEGLSAFLDRRTPSWRQ